MRFLYCTDLHGDVQKYEAVIKYAIENDIKLIHLGADILPKGPNIQERQKKFIKVFLKVFYNECKKIGIDVLAFFGNDDLYSRKKYFKEYAQLLDEVPFEKEGYTFKAYGYVPDYPFGLKSGCKLDYPGWTCPDEYTQEPVEFTDKGIIIIQDPVQYFLDKGTIKEDLVKISADNKTIMAIHCPPKFLGLDVCLKKSERPTDTKINGFYYTKKEVGSKSITDWIAINNPLLSLHGHIHESYLASGIWKVNMGKTTVIQPGQISVGTTVVDIDVSDKWYNGVKAKLIQL
jgi:Icc-related predicted phosphoesterase